MTHDVIIVGGSFAGLAAALQLGRARRPTLVLDTGRPRNRFAREAHGILGHDGKPPAVIRGEAVSQLCAYPAIELRTAEVVSARGERDAFVVSSSDGREQRARRLVLATGLADELPEIAGLAERWGVRVLHCPYCHGYEVRDLPLGVLANHPLSGHQGLLIADWGPTTYFTQGRYPCDAEQTARMKTRGVRIEEVPIVELLGDSPALDAVRLADGRVVPMHALFTAPKIRFASPLPEQLGCAVEEGPLGPYLRVDAMKETSVPGVYAAGDLAQPMHNATLAIASGVLAGVGAHQSLAFAG